MKVKLEWYEILAGAHVGMIRKIECLRQGKRDAHGLNKPHDWTLTIEGAIAELAVAKALGLYWNHGVNTWKAPDFLPNIQVRLSQHPESPQLVFRPGDNPDHVYILVTYGTGADEYVILGWITGQAAMQERYKDAPGGRPAAYFVPASDLEPIEKLSKE